ncbi:MAG: glycosyltransferase family 2 protein [Agathobacter sp.]|nr:glycosyltransferase family 2 protein [Agathobacter sp.]
MYRTEKTAILLATYNGEKYIREQIDSILAQTDTDWVLYIHDDGSKDQTMEVVKEYVDKYPEQIIVVEGAPTGGAKSNFFYLFHQVEAPFYMCCDQDDVWLPEKIEITRKEMENLIRGDEDKPALVFTELGVVDGELNVIAENMRDYQGLDCKNVRLNRALIQNVVTGCTMMVNRVLRDEMTKITEYTDVLMHDWWATLVAVRFGKVSFIEQPTILYRQHGNNGVGASNANSLMYQMKRMLQGEEIKQSLVNTRKQARLFADIYKEEENSLVKQYADLGNKGKLSRLQFYKKYDVKKSTRAKNIGLMIWG